MAFPNYYLQLISNIPGDFGKVIYPPVPDTVDWSKGVCFCGWIYVDSLFPGEIWDIFRIYQVPMAEEIRVYFENMDPDLYIKGVIQDAGHTQIAAGIPIPPASWQFFKIRFMPDGLQFGLNDDEAWTVDTTPDPIYPQLPNGTVYEMMTGHLASGDIIDIGVGRQKIYLGNLSLVDMNTIYSDEVSLYI